MAQQLSLDDVRRAWSARDPELANLLIALCAASDERLKTPVPEGAPTYQSFTREFRGWRFKRKSPQERARYRIDTMRALEAQQESVPMPARLGSHEVLLDLWARAQEPGGAYERQMLLTTIGGIALRWGPWRALKRIFKEAEATGDTEILGALSARFDAQLAASSGSVVRAGGEISEVSRHTLAYLCRRAWRFLRRRAEGLPASYADAAVDFLRFYTDQTSWNHTWVYNHVLFHDSGKFNRRRFRFGWRDRNLNPLKLRAYPELWRRSPRPLFTLLERASSEKAREYATNALQSDFRAMLRDVEPSWVTRLIAVGSATIDRFVIWLLGNVPRFEQSAFRELGLHDAVLRLLDSDADEARVYAADYARTHARDLSLGRLILLANNSNASVRKLAGDLLSARDPRKEVGLDAWGRLLGTQHGHELAATALRKHFGARELTPEWFTALFLDSRDQVVDFAAELLPKVHTAKALGADYFRRLLDAPEIGHRATRFALQSASGYPVSDYPADFWRRLLLRGHSRSTMIAWIREDKVKADALGAGFWRSLAFHPTWEADPWVQELREKGPSWARELSFDESLADLAFELLGDVRKFTPDQLGFEWLMVLVQRAEPRYFDFATEYMIKAFLPADFAPAGEGEAEESGSAAAEGATVDLGGKSFLFTGKLKTMKRADATKMVTAAGGANASSVNAKLDYLVIGDEGSALYGEGRKGSKQVAGEKLIAKGAKLKIISETAFLQMLAGGEREFSDDAVAAGCARLWEMATEPGPDDAPLARFARLYIRRHHPDIALKLTDRPVDPGAEVPADFLSWERFAPLFAEPREALRTFAVEFGRWELNRWSPPLFELVVLAEGPHREVRTFVEEALLADPDDVDTKRFRIDPARLSGDAVYAFCESLRPQARALGMELIRRHPALAIPEELFRLSESPDRQVCGFVVKTLWSLYRDRGTTPGWVPPAEPKRRGKEKGEAVEEHPQGVGAPARPEKLPASHQALRDFMRRMLFSVPPAKLPAATGNERSRGPRQRPLSARRAKLALVEVVRDLAIEEHDFAAVVAPVLDEFMGSRGASERAACLVALARIAKAHADLNLLAKEVA